MFLNFLWDTINVLGNAETKIDGVLTNSVHFSGHFADYINWFPKVNSGRNRIFKKCIQLIYTFN